MILLALALARDEPTEAAPCEGGWSGVLVEGPALLLDDGVRYGLLVPEGLCGGSWPESMDCQGAAGRVQVCGQARQLGFGAFVVDVESIHDLPDPVLEPRVQSATVMPACDGGFIAELRVDGLPGGTLLLHEGRLRAWDGLLVVRSDQPLESLEVGFVLGESTAGVEVLLEPVEGSCPQLEVVSAQTSYLCQGIPAPRQWTSSVALSGPQPTARVRDVRLDGVAVPARTRWHADKLWVDAASVGTAPSELSLLVDGHALSVPLSPVDQVCTAP